MSQGREGGPRHERLPTTSTPPAAGPAETRFAEDLERAGRGDTRAWERIGRMLAEFMILDLRRQGHADAQIAARLHVSVAELPALVDWVPACAVRRVGAASRVGDLKDSA